LYFISAILVAVLDQITKHIVSTNMSLYQSITIVPKLFDLCYILNDGAAWGIFSGKQTLLQVFTAAMILFVTAYVITGRKKIKWPEKLALGLIIGGGIGNLIDRVMNGVVVDFLDIHIIPVFNVADMGVTIGCLLLLIVVLKSE